MKSAKWGGQEICCLLPSILSPDGSSTLGWLRHDFCWPRKRANTSKTEDGSEGEGEVEEKTGDHSDADTEELAAERERRKKEREV